MASSSFNATSSPPHSSNGRRFAIFLLLSLVFLSGCTQPILSSNDPHERFRSIGGELLEERPPGQVLDLARVEGPTEYQVLLEQMDDVLEGRAKRLAFSTGEDGFQRLKEHFARMTREQFGYEDPTPESVAYRSAYFRLHYEYVVE